MSGLVLVLLLDIVVTASVLLLYAFSEGFHSTMTEIFNALVNGLCWLTDHTWGRAVRARARRRELAAQSETDGLAARLAELEGWDAQWDRIRMSGGTPVWHPTYGWIPDATVCACGYITECNTWCGDGHADGGPCAEHEVTEYVRVPVVPAAWWKQGNFTISIHGRSLELIKSYGMTVEEWSATVKRAMQEAGGAL